MKIQNVLASGLLAVVALSFVGSANAVVIQQQDPDFIVIEAEAYSLLEGDEFVNWLEVGEGEFETDYGSEVLPPDSGVSGTALYDQPGGSNLEGTATYELEFTTPGIYYFYQHYTMYETNNIPDDNYGNEDSMYLPLDFNELPIQAGWYSYPKLSHNSPSEEPPFWEGNFHWAWIDDLNSGELVEYEVTDADVGSVLEFSIGTRERGSTLDAMILHQVPDLFPEELDEILFSTEPPAPVDVLRAGDANQDFSFDQLDIVQVSVAAKYLTGEPATWGEGDWDGAPGGEQGNPPAGNGFFDQVDIISALAGGIYLTGPYNALAPGGDDSDEQTSLVYDQGSGELSVDAPASTNLTSIFVTSAGNSFVGDKPPVLDGPFDSFAADNIFKSTIGSSFGDISFGNVLPAGMSEADVLADLTASGSLDGGGGLGDVDLIYIPEPTSILLLAFGLAGLAMIRRKRR